MPETLCTTEPSTTTAYLPGNDVRPPPPTGRRAVRLAEDCVGFTDARGRFWRVEERAAPPTPWARSPRYLVFESVTVVRRVWAVPTGWPSLDADALEALSEQR
jgi:hypothetical protein